MLSYFSSSIVPALLLMRIICFVRMLRHWAAWRGASLCVGPRGVRESVHHPLSLQDDAGVVAPGFWSVWPLDIGVSATRVLRVGGPYVAESLNSQGREYISEKEREREWGIKVRWIPRVG